VPGFPGLPAYPCDRVGVDAAKGGFEAGELRR
jgi:hypothetical protein